MPAPAPTATAGVVEKPPRSRPPVDLPWVIFVDFYEEPDRQYRVASLAEAIELVHGWLQAGCVSHQYLREGVALDKAKIEDIVQHVFPIGTVKHFEIRYSPLSK